MMSKYDSPGAGEHTTTFEDFFVSSTDEKNVEESEEFSNQKKEDRSEYEQKVDEYLDKVKKAHDELDELGLHENEEVPMKEPPRWFFEKIHENQKHYWETLASLRGWLIYHDKNNNGDQFELSRWIDVVEKILKDFYEFDSVRGLEAPTDGLFSKNWDFCHEGRKPFSEIGLH